MPRRRAERAVVAAACALVLAPGLAGPSARAQQPSPSAAQAQPPSRRVLITVPATLEGGDALERTVAGALAGLEVSVEMIREPELAPNAPIDAPPPPHGSLARAWLLGGDGGFTVFVVHDAWNRVLVRPIPHRGPLDAVICEQVALILHAAVDSILAGARIGVDRAELSSTAAAQPSAPAELEGRMVAIPDGRSRDAAPTAMRLGFAAHYAARLRDDLGGEHTPGLSVDMTLGEHAARAVLRATLGVSLPHAIERSGTRLELATSRFALAAGLELGATDAGKLRLGGLFGLAFERVEASADLTLRAAGVERRTRPAAGLWVAYLLPLGVVYLQLMAVAELELRDFRYVLLDDGEEALLADPGRFVPGLVLEVGHAP